MNKTKFTATVRHQKGKIETGKIHSVSLLPFVGKKVVVKIREAVDNE